jgi:uncharacterized protein
MRIIRYLTGRGKKTKEEWAEYWESVCNKCGLCCFERRLKWNGEVIIEYDKPCRYLDTNTRLCTIYENRFKICSNCNKVTMYHALFGRYMPSQCAYVQTFRKKKK